MSAWIDNDDLQQETDTTTAAYADQFAQLAFVFLFLYVISSLRTTIEQVQAEFEREARAKAAVQEEVVEPVKDMALEQIDPEELAKRVAAAEARAIKNAEQMLQQAQAMQQAMQQADRELEAV